MSLEVRREGEWTRPRPQPDTVSADYWSALADGRLLIQRCPACGHRQFFPRALCTACGAEPAWEEASGRGTVHTFTVIRQNGMPSFRQSVPYVVAMVDLEEGVRVMGNITGCPVDDVRVGMAVRAYAVDIGEGLAVAQWEPTGEG